MPASFDDLLSESLPPDGQKRQYLLLYMRDLPIPQNLAIADEDVAPFRRRLYRPAAEMALDAPFFWLSTFHSQEVLISLSDIDYVNFLYEIELPLTALIKDSAREGQHRAQEDQREGTVDLYFRDRPQPISIQVTNSVELKQIFEMLSVQKAGDLPPFIRFTAADSEVVAFRPERLTLLIAHRGSVQMTTEADYEALFGEG